MQPLGRCFLVQDLHLFTSSLLPSSWHLHLIQLSFGLEIFKFLLVCLHNISEQNYLFIVSVSATSILLHLCLFWLLSHPTYLELLRSHLIHPSAYAWLIIPEIRILNVL